MRNIPDSPVGGPAIPAFRWSHLALAAIVSFPFLFYFQVFPNYRNPNELSRLLLISAIVDDGSIQIDKALKRFGDCQDISYFEGHYYSNKAIGYSLLGAPAYLLFRSAGQGQSDVLLYLLRIFLNIIPLLAFSLLFFRCLQKDLNVGNFAYVLLIAFLFGTLIFPYAQQFASHMITGLFLFLAFYFLVHRDSARHAATAGLLLGYSFVLEIPSLVLFPLFLIWVAVHKRRVLLPFAAGLAVGSLPAFLYNDSAFGHPLRWSYQFVATPELKAVHQEGYVGASLPSLIILWKLTFGSNRGFFHFMPHLLFGIGGMVMAFRHSRKNWLIPSIFVATVLFYSGYASWDGGWSFGPRFLTPMVPFLVYATAQWFGSMDSTLLRARILVSVYLFLVGITIPMMLMGASTTLLSPRFLPLILFWEVPVMFWRGLTGLHWGDIVSLPLFVVQLLTILLVMSPMILLLRRARLNAGKALILLAVVGCTFLVSAVVTPYVEARMPAAHCLAIGRIGFMQAQYSRALVFLNRARQRSRNSGVGLEAEAWIQAIQEKVRTAPPQ